MNRNLIPAALSCVLAVACQGGGDSKKSSLPGVEVRTEVTEAGDESASSFKVRAERSVKLREDLANLEDFADNINDYEITVSAPRTVTGATLVCKKDTGVSFEAEQVSGFSALTGSASVNLGLYPADSDAVTVTCAVTDATNTELLRFERILRKGYVVRGTQSLGSLGALDMDTLVLLEKSELLYGAKDVNLKVGTLVSKRGAISTFRASDVTKTLPRMDGESGGMLMLNATNAIGRVTFNLRGKNAGIQDQTPQQPKPKPRGADGGTSATSLDGADGARGDDAINGFHGFAGGDSGRVILSVANETTLEASFIFSPGLGSDGTEPSPPGRGGEGGRAGSWTYFSGTACPVSTDHPDLKCGDRTVVGKPGRRGADGNPGVRGERGADGAIQKSIFSIQATGQKLEITNSWSNILGDL